MKNFVTIILVVAALIGGYALISKKSNTPEAKPPQQTETINNPTQQPLPTTNNAPTNSITQEKFVVAYTDSGFEPRTITVPVGTTVTFTDNSDASMWVASDPHPAHTNFPAFDEKQGIPKGESYAFTFKKKGVFNYHNHLSPKDTGNVTVE